MKVFFDLETTGKDHHSCEIVEAFFISKVGKLHLYNRPFKWSEEAEKIHGIPWARVSNEPSIDFNLDRIFNYLRSIPKPIEFWCYANPNSMIDGVYTYCHFDNAVLHNTASINNRLFEYRHIIKEHTVNSVHPLAKKAFPNIVGGYSQENVAKYLGIKYNAHSAESDTMALIEIYKQAITKSRQGELILRPR